MVQLKSLYADPESRQIRDVITTPTGQITIFEPTMEDTQAIMELQDLVASFNQDGDESTNYLDISGVTVLKDIIPRLTDIEIPEDMTDEEIAKVVENPTVEMRSVMSYLSSIVTHIYKLMILNYKNDLELQDLVKDSEEISNQTMGMYIRNAVKTDEGRSSISEIQKQATALVKQEEQDGSAPKQAEVATADQKLDTTAKVLDPNNYNKELSDSLSDKYGDVFQ